MQKEAAIRASLTSNREDWLGLEFLLVNISHALVEDKIHTQLLVFQQKVAGVQRCGGLHQQNEHKSR